MNEQQEEALERELLKTYGLASLGAVGVHRTDPIAGVGMRLYIRGDARVKLVQTAQATGESMSRIVTRLIRENL